MNAPHPPEPRPEPGPESGPESGRESGPERRDALLAAVRESYQLLDPVPSDLVPRIQAALAMAGSDLDAREAMALASYYGGLAITQALVGYVHAVSHNLGARYGIPHGLGNAMVLPHVLELLEQTAADRLAAIASSKDRLSGPVVAGDPA